MTFTLSLNRKKQNKGRIGNRNWSYHRQVQIAGVKKRDVTQFKTVIRDLTQKKKKKKHTPPQKKNNKKKKKKQKQKKKKKKKHHTHHPSKGRGAVVGETKKGSI